MVAPRLTYTSDNYIKGVCVVVEAVNVLLSSNDTLMMHQHSLSIFDVLFLHNAS